MQFDNDGLNQRGQRDRVVDPRLGIADAELESVEKRMQPDVPPDFLPLSMQLVRDQKLQVILVLRETFERVGNAGARKALKDVMPVSL